MKIEVNRDKCIAAGNCVVHSPNVFDQDEEDGVVVLLLDNPPAEENESARKAAAVCPAQAIIVSE